MDESSRLNPGCRWTGVDLRPEALAHTSALIRGAGSGSEFSSVCCRVEDVPMVFSGEIADAVIANPPFGTLGSGRTSPVTSRSTSRAGSDMLLHHFIRAAAHLLVPGGELVLVGRPAMLPDILMGCSAWGLSPILLQPVGPRGHRAIHILLSCRKGSGSELVIGPQRSADELISAVGTE
jgi:tRNA1(Val) A37 N6-methylase TrmN6